MATLQAARAHLMGLPLESAYSWGLNRAIFYAAAKRGFRGGGAKSRETGGARAAGHPAGEKAEAEAYHLGDEMAYKAGGTGKLLFIIGDKPQTKEDFERQIAARFQGHFREAWEEALDYVKHFDRATLSSGSGFFSSVYRPKRDEFATKWSELAEKAPAKAAVVQPVRTKKRVRAASR